MIILSSKKQPKSSEYYLIMKFCKFLDSLLRKSLFNHIIFGNRNIILRHMRITNATVSKLNQFIEPKTTFAAFLSEGMKEK